MINIPPCAAIPNLSLCDAMPLGSVPLRGKDSA
jgi:hypothetical protein